MINVSVTISPVKDADGRVVGASKIARDVTQHKRAEELLPLACEAAEVGLWDVDLASNTLFWDARCKAMFGISPDVAVTMNDFYSGLHPDDLDATKLAYLMAQRSGDRAHYDVEYRVCGKEDGVLRWIAATGRGIFDHNGICVRFVGTTRDITTRKEVERRRDVMASLADLIQSVDTKSALDQACSILGQNFEASRVGVAELHKSEDLFNYTTCWTDVSGHFPAR